MFGLHNYSGSCWVNAALQSFFRIPDVQARYTEGRVDKKNIVDVCLARIWKSKGEDGLRDFFEAVRTDTMPAGRGIGDSHELLQYLCDKLPFLDEICRFKIAHSLKCNTCGEKNITHDSVIEFPFDSVEGRNVPLSNCIAKTQHPIPLKLWLKKQASRTAGLCIMLS
jgi:ubiquitin C-terminal hydrolase